MWRSQKSKLGKRSRKCICQFALIGFLILNLLSYLGAYTLTHFKAPGHWGPGLPKPTSSKRPTDIGLEYVTHRIPVNQTEWIETWFIPVHPSGSKALEPNQSGSKKSLSRGTILLFPGNAGSKAKQLLAPAQIFHDLGYDALLVDFRGVGGSSGNTTTIGAREAKDVALAVDYAEQSKLNQPFVLYGISMGTAAILKAIAQEKVKPDGVILELPFTRLLDAVRSRLKAIGLPTFPIAELLVFWGSLQHGFNGFTHNPVDYARQVQCPTLLLHGKLDQWTTVGEINQILQNLQGAKQLVIFPNTGHNLLVTVDQKFWKYSIAEFLRK